MRSRILQTIERWREFAKDMRGEWEVNYASGVERCATDLEELLREEPEPDVVTTLEISGPDITATLETMHGLLAALDARTKNIQDAIAAYRHAATVERERLWTAIRSDLDRHEDSELATFARVRIGLAAIFKREGGG